MRASVLTTLGSLLVLLTPATPAEARGSYAAKYAHETYQFKCPPGTVLSQDDQVKGCLDSNGKSHGPKLVLCPGVRDHGLQRRSFFWFNHGVLHGQYRHRKCTASPEGSEFEEEGYYFNDERHGMVVWRDISGKVHDSCTYVNGKLEGTCIEHVPSDSSYAKAGFVTKRHYRAHCQFKVEHLDAAGKVFRSCEILGCKTEGPCTNTFQSPRGVPLLRSLTASTVTSALRACYEVQPVVTRTPRLVGDYFTGPFVEAMVVAPARRSQGTVLVQAKVRVRSFGAVDDGNETDPSWEGWRTVQVEFVTARGGYRPVQCPWRW
jgi:hypothetical protein